MWCSTGQKRSHVSVAVSRVHVPGAVSVSREVLRACQVSYSVARVYYGVQQGFQVQVHASVASLLDEPRPAAAVEVAAVEVAQGCSRQPCCLSSHGPAAEV